MAFLNSNNFCRWIDLGTELLQNGDFSICNNLTPDFWDENDVAPVGSNEEIWDCSGGGFTTALGIGDTSTTGLSQKISIKKGKLYWIKYNIFETVPKDTTFYVYFINASVNKIVKQVIINNVDPSDDYDFFVVADSDYTKILTVATVETSTIHPRIYNLQVYEMNDECFYTLPLYKGDGINIFGNFVLDDSVVPFSGLKVGLWSKDLGIYLRNITTINQIIISGDNYSFYFDEWIVPDLPNDNFRFIIYRENPDTQLYLSNSFRKIPNTNYTAWVKYNNSVDTLGYLYESAPSFFNEFRIDLWTGRPNFNENVKGYETYEGELIKVKSDIQKLIEFQTRFFDAGSHEAFFSMLSHSSIEIDGITYKKGEQSYDITWSEDDDNKIGNGIVNLLVDDYSAAIQTC